MAKAAAAQSLSAGNARVLVKPKACHKRSNMALRITV
jgi:hypothetical protein